MQCNVIELELLRMQKQGQASRRGDGDMGGLGSWGEQGFIFCDPAPAHKHKIESHLSTL